MPLAEALSDALDDAPAIGSFAASGMTPAVFCRIQVMGHGTIGLPISEAQAADLHAAGTRAAHGKGTLTVLDEAVRRCRQYPAGQVSVDAAWSKALGNIRDAAVAALGAPPDATLTLYQLLVYAPGDFFVPHRDTEKEPGMFATLVVALPSEHSGGDLVVRHQGAQRIIPLDSEASFAWAAFYADCVHELRPVRSGYRVVLVYNVVRAGAATAPTPVDGPAAALAARLREWDTSHNKLLVPLEHRYTQAELGWNGLKGRDAAAAGLLRAAATEAGCELELGLLEVFRTYDAQPLYDDYRRRRRSAGPTDYEVGELIDESSSLSLVGGGTLAWQEEEICPPGLGEPDEEDFEEYTGNAGSTLDRTYERAMLVVWPRRHEGAVWGAASGSAGVAALRRLMDGKAGAGRIAACADGVVAGWSGTAALGDLIRLLAKIPGHKALRALIAGLAERYATTEHPLVVDALGLFDDATAGSLLEGIVRGSLAGHPAPVTALVARATEERPGAWAGAAVRYLLTSLPGIGWGWSGPPICERPALVVAGLRITDQQEDPDLAHDFVSALLKAPERWPLDGVLTEAAIALRQEAPLGWAALHEAVSAHLRQRMAEDIAPPPDFRRPTEALTCRCADCAPVRAFLAHPGQQALEVQAVEATRQHVQASASKADLVFHTLKRARPHTLVLTKTTRSWEERVARRKQDDVAARALGLL